MSQPPLNDNKPPLARRRNAAPPPDAAEDAAGVEEPRVFATDSPPGGHMGSGGDPSEGKRD